MAPEILERRRAMRTIVTTNTPPTIPCCARQAAEKSLAASPDVASKTKYEISDFMLYPIANIEKNLGAKAAHAYDRLLKWVRPAESITEASSN